MPSIMCPQCKRTYNAPDKAMGRQVKCPACQSEFKAEEIQKQLPDTVKMTVEEVERYYGKKKENPST